MKWFPDKIPAYLPTAIVAIAIGYLTLWPDPLGDCSPELFPHADKVVHALMFGGLSAAIVFDRCRRRAAVNRSTALSSALISLAAGIVVELLQAMMDLGRSADALDVAADAVGAFLFAFITVKILDKFPNLS